MTTLLSWSRVKIKMLRQCFACYRKFEAGSQMVMSTCRNEDGIYNIHSCDACESLMREFQYGYDDNESAFLPGCVGEGLNPGQTPEMLLDELRNKKTPTL